MIAALLMALVAQGQPGTRPGDDAEALVRRTQAAVEAGRAPAGRARWQVRLAARADDDTALLALATLDRLTYHDADAEREYAALRRGGATEPYALLGLGLLRTQQARLSEADPLLRRAAA